MEGDKASLISFDLTTHVDIPLVLFSLYKISDEKKEDSCIRYVNWSLVRGYPAG